MRGIYTSYYAKAAKLEEPAVFVRISQSQPAWFGKPVIEERKFYPPWEIIKNYKAGVITWEEYERKYVAQLNDYDAEECRQYLIALSERYDLPIVLLCYEASDKMCHRHILAEWLDMGIKELANEIR